MQLHATIKGTCKKLTMSKENERMFLDDIVTEHSGLVAYSENNLINGNYTFT